MIESEAMARAIELAWRGWGRVQPNPLVGAVVLGADGAVAGEGWHAEWGERHAEPAALAAAGERARGGTLVVTLEPCAHRGKQPPCTDAVLAAGVRRVVVALADPNPVAAGGAARLREAGVEVSIGLRRAVAAAQNAIFLHGFGAEAASRPYVALKLATSLDGLIADASGSSRWVSGAAARERVHWLRAGFDAVAVGGRTAWSDDPSLTVRGPVTPRRPPRRVVIERSPALEPTQTLARTARETPTHLVALQPVAPARRAAFEAAGVAVHEADSLAGALAALRADGVASLLVEGGGRLAGALLADDLVDRLYWVQSPVWLGAGAPAFTGLPPRALAEAPRWTVTDRAALGEDTILVLDRPCSPASSPR